MESKGVRRLLGVVVGFLMFLGVGASSTRYLYEPANLGFLEFPTVALLHAAFGGVYLAFASFQFVGRVRSRHPGYHHWTGESVRLDRHGGRSNGLARGFHDPLQGVKS